MKRGMEPVNEPSETGSHIVDLVPFFNNDGISYRERTGDGAFNIWSNTYPAEDLPPSDSLVEVGGIRFRFPSKENGDHNNVVCVGQLVTVKRGRYDWIYVLAAAERRTEDEVLLHFERGVVDPEWLRVSDFWPAPPRFGEVLAFRGSRMHYPRHVQEGLCPSIWRQRIPVTRGAPLSAVRLPENPAIHIFAMTLVATAALPRRSESGD